MWHNQAALNSGGLAYQWSDPSEGQGCLGRNSHAVLLLAYKRPALTAEVIRSLRVVQPKRLYFCVDGPKNASESAECAEVQALTFRVDWDCEITTRFRDHNMGCRRGVVDAVSWFFDHEEMGIVLEDDVVPHPSFFQFASQLLEKYRDDTRIMKISGFNPVGWRLDTGHDYFYSHLSFSWGWASWRRAWAHYSASTHQLKEITKMGARRFPAIDKPRQKALSAVAQGLDTWDYQWDLSIASQNGLHIVPSVNLVENIGFGPGATHTVSRCAPEAYVRSRNLDMVALRSPAVVMPDIRVHRKIRAWQKRAAWFRRLCRRLPVKKPKQIGHMMKVAGLIPGESRVN